MNVAAPNRPPRVARPAVASRPAPVAARDAVAARRRSVRVGKAIVAVLVLVSIALGMQVSLINRQRELDTVQNRIDELRATNQDLVEQLTTAQSTERLREVAEQRLGMVDGADARSVPSPRGVIAPVEPGGR
ncbi:MAG: hypothetical protein R2698_00345 [Microthrixaceae bacterium]